MNEHLKRCENASQATEIFEDDAVTRKASPITVWVQYIARFDRPIGKIMEKLELGIRYSHQTIVKSGYTISQCTGCFMNYTKKFFLS